MKVPIFVRPLTEAEREALEAGLHSRDAFTLRRCQILLASAARQTPSEIARNLGCASQTVRNAVHDFEMRGLACLKRGSNVPISVQPVLTAEKREQLREILHQSPRHFGKPVLWPGTGDASVWTLKLLAEVCHEQGLSDWEPVLSDRQGSRHRPSWMPSRAWG